MTRPSYSDYTSKDTVLTEKKLKTVMNIHISLYIVQERDWHSSKCSQLKAKENLYSQIFPVSSNRESKRILLNTSEIKGTVFIFSVYTITWEQKTLKAAMFVDSNTCFARVNDRHPLGPHLLILKFQEAPQPALNYDCIFSGKNMNNWKWT